MPSPFSKALARSGVSVEAARAEAEETVDKVRSSSELERILALPRRKPGYTTSGVKAEDLVDPMTQEFRAPGGTMVLRPLQALALAELYENRALVGRLLVGEGKTLITYLAPTMMGSKRPLLVLPGALVDKTRREFRELRKHWAGPHPDAFPIVSFEYLSNPSQGSCPVSGRQEYLFRQKPDLLILDEAHKAKNTKSITTKRLAKFRKAFPDVPVVILTGTLYRKSIKDMAHLLDWALGARSPMPRKYHDVDYWSRALDANVTQRIRPGSLARLSDQPLRSGDEGLEDLREAFRSRLASTPGFVSSQSKGLDCSLVISGYEPLRECSAITNAFQTLRGEWSSPGGQTFADRIQMSACARQLALGMFYRWNPDPPKQWREARKAYNSWARDTLSNNGRGMDSEVQLLNALRQGLYNDQGLYAAWTRLRDEERARTGHKDPPTEAVWISDEAIEACAAWLGKHKDGLVFYEHVHFALRLAKETGVKMFGQGGLAADGSPIEAHRGPALLSAPANRTGRNLQKWNTALLLCSPDEQLLGRLHREGQQADEVQFFVYLPAKEQHAGFWNARVLDMSAMGEQAKLAYADITIPKTIEKRGARWV